MRQTLSQLTLAAAIAVFALTAGSGAADDFKVEEGFTLLFNGTDLTGWKMTKGGESLDGKAEAAKGRFTVKEGAIVIDPKVKGDLRIQTAKQFGKDAHIKFEFRPGAGCNNDLFFRGTKFDLKTPDVKNLKEGEWNSFEIIVSGDSAEFKCNGETQRKMKIKSGATPLEIRAEFGPIEIRRLRIKAES
jgi:hypothetical protein